MLSLIGTTACTHPPRFTRVVLPPQPHVSLNIHVRIAGVPTGTFLGASIASFVDSGQTTVKGHMHKPPHARSGYACALGRQYPAMKLFQNKFWCLFSNFGYSVMHTLRTYECA